MSTRFDNRRSDPQAPRRSTAFDVHAPDPSRAIRTTAVSEDAQSSASGPTDLTA